MRGLYRFLKSTMIGGLGILVPIIALLAVVVWAVNIALKVVMPVFEWLPDKSVGVVLSAQGFNAGGVSSGVFKVSAAPQKSVDGTARLVTGDVKAKLEKVDFTLPAGQGIRLLNWREVPTVD